jgi:hypothetical protein
MDGGGSDGVTSADLGSDGVLADVKVSLALVPKSD